MHITFHRCTNVRLDNVFPSNANSVTLEIEHDDIRSEITLYDLPTEVTDKFNAFRDKWTRDADQEATHEHYQFALKAFNND